MYEVKIPQRFEYNVLNKDNFGIYMKIDYLTVIFNDCSMYDVLSWIDHEDSIIEFMLNQYETIRGLDTKFIYNFNGIELEVQDLTYYKDFNGLMDASVFEMILPKIRLNLSGSCLDYLRSCGIDMDERVYVEPDLPEGGSYHFTRVDFAYDFINYADYFMPELKRYIEENILPSGRVPVRGVTGGCSATIRTGKEFTIYLGSSNSERMLRVYDKRLEQMDLESGVYVKENPFNNPDSWFRIEWQCRNKFADNLLFNQIDKLSILKKIFNYYRFSERKRSSEGREDIDFWEKLLNWEDVVLPSIRQNLHLVKYKPRSERIIEWVENVAVKNIIAFLELRKVSGLNEAISSYLSNLRNSDSTSQRRYIAFLNLINELKLDLSDVNKVGLVIKDNVFCWNNI